MKAESIYKNSYTKRWSLFFRLVRKFNMAVPFPLPSLQIDMWSLLKEEQVTSSISEPLEVKYPPCRKACPAGINVQAYIALIAQGKFKEALDIIRQSIPFPSVCGRVCFAPCEDACARKDVDKALSIRLLKRLVADQEFALELKETPNRVPRAQGPKIAIIGSGPSGLTAAYELTQMGYQVTIFDSAPKPGGALRYYIPEYRLPEEVLIAEINHIVKAGVDMRMETTVGRDITIDEMKKQGYEALFIASGAHHCVSLNIEGEELKGVFHALDFLRDVRCGAITDVGEKVAVVGGGNVAIDAARTARRLGSDEVILLYRRSEKEMPAHRHEVEDAKSEGVRFQFLVSPKRIQERNGEAARIECIKNELGQPDESGRRRPVPIEGSEFTIPVDSVLLGIGERPDVTFLPEEVEVARGNRIVVDEVTLETRLPGVFAGGDAVTGPASVIEAIAAGKKAAVSIDRYIRGVDLKAGRTKEFPEIAWMSEETSLEKKPRQTVPCLDPTARIRGFKEVELGFTREVGLSEAHRCLFCGPCSECLENEKLCDADDVLVDEDRCIACANCEKVCDYAAIKVAKSVAKVDPLLCKGCGTCVAECPAEALAMQNFSDDKISAQIKGASTHWSTGKTPQTLVFVCNWSWDADAKGFEWPQNVCVIPVRCSGRVDPIHVLQAFLLGVDGVMIISCDTKDCHYGFGSFAAEKRVGQMKEWLHAAGINRERLRIAPSRVGNERHLTEVLKGFSSELEKIGSTPLKETLKAEGVNLSSKKLM